MKNWKFVWGQKGRKPSVNQLDHETIAKDKETGTLYVLAESSGGAKEVVEIGGSSSANNHPRSHQIDSADDHPAVPEADYNKLVATNAKTGAIELISKDSFSGESLLLQADTSTFSGLRVQLTAGENLSKGQACYMSAAKMYRGDADAIATSYCFAVATDTISADASGIFMLLGIIGGYSSLTPGAPVFLSSSPGALTQAIPAGTNKVVQILGVAISATHIYFNPDLAQVELL